MVRPAPELFIFWGMCAIGAAALGMAAYVHLTWLRPTDDFIAEVSAPSWPLVLGLAMYGAMMLALAALERRSEH
jgi:hypothetical protein